ncbi:hypothetical protein CAEBREN_24648 [Caenorhabditis brenneri]|uniref:Uncharacterized protein n=1 Tax=Caenorhabditis brenneri TaxID=135651 RepID=G0PI94_CAEBE|nr:hypothetical protein CAEBREN_24648 [Caenorhabditis brenneri]
MSRTFLIFVLLGAVLVLEAYKVPSDAATQLKLKKRGQACMKRILPKNGPSMSLQRELAVSFKDWNGQFY